MDPKSITNDIIKNISKEVEPYKINNIFELVSKLTEIQSDKNIYPKNELIETQTSELLENKKKKLIFMSAGSNGVVLRDERSDEFVYKISIMSDSHELHYQNYIESIYLNYFNINYPEHIELDYFPIQNFITQITTFGIFKEQYDISDEIISKLEYNFIRRDDDYILINLMKNHRTNLFDLIGTFSKNDLSNNFDKIAKKVFKSLNFIHKNNMLHGDIKSSNIVVNNDVCKIIDMGGLKMIGNKTYDKTCTLTYRSPEELLYEYNNSGSKIKSSEPDVFFPLYGFRSEVWSVGIILLELILGYNPLSLIYNDLKLNAKGNNQEEIDLDIEQKLCTILNSKTHIEINLDILEKRKFRNPVSLKNKLERILSINPAIRYENLDELYFDLFEEVLEPPKKVVQSEPVYRVVQEYLDIFNTFRKNNYQLMSEILLQLNSMNCLPLSISILDRYFLILLELQDENTILFLNTPDSGQILPEKILLFVASALISSSIINRKIMTYPKIFIKLNRLGMTENKLTTSDIPTIKNLIVDITEILNYNIVIDKYMFSDRTNLLKIMDEYTILYNKQY